MQRRINVINVYSDLNEHLDFIVEIENEFEIERAEQIIEEAYNDWWDLENNPELQFVMMGDYIRSKLTINGIKHSWYTKED